MKNLQDDIETFLGTDSRPTNGSGISSHEGFANHLDAGALGECGTGLMERDLWPMGGSADETFLERVFPKLKFRWEMGQEKYQKDVMSRCTKEFDTEFDTEFDAINECMTMSVEGA